VVVDHKINNPIPGVQFSDVAGTEPVPAIIFKAAGGGGHVLDHTWGGGDGLGVGLGLGVEGGGDHDDADDHDDSDHDGDDAHRAPPLFAFKLP